MQGGNIMFLKWTHGSVRITGRWDRSSDEVVTTTNTGGTIEIAYYGELAVLHFDIKDNKQTMPHIWIQVDGGARIEASLEPFIRIQTQSMTTGEGILHNLKIIFKSAVEEQARWYAPLVGKLSFKGIDVQKPGELNKDNRRIIEFVGDSITEGVLIDAGHNFYDIDQLNRPYEDDVCATYAWLTAEKLNLIPRIMGYGAVGATKSGQGSVPKAGEAYPFVYDQCALKETEPDFIVINHGANDMGSTAENYTCEYYELLRIIRKINPSSKIVCLSAFYGVYPRELGEVINKFNYEFKDSVEFIDTTGWIPKEPLHPMRDGHIIIAQKLSEILSRGGTF